jgi:peptide/nickel transport system ATP-binding protein
VADDTAPLVEVAGLQVTAGPAHQVIVDDVSFSIARGEVLALIGESGSGKTTIALALMGYARSGCTITGGRVRVGTVEPTGLTPAALARFRGRTVSYIAPSAAAAFNPSQRIMAQVIENVLIHRLMPRKAAEAKARPVPCARPSRSGRSGRAVPAPGVGRPVAAADGGNGADH